MPCRDGGDSYLTTTNADQEQIFRGEIRRLEQRCDYLTDLLCKQCTLIEQEQHNDDLIHKEIIRWWKGHKALDHKRKVAEKKAKEEAIEHKKKQLKELANELAALESEK